MLTIEVELWRLPNIVNIYSFICFKATPEMRNFYEINVLYMVYVAYLEYY